MNFREYLRIRLEHGYYSEGGQGDLKIVTIVCIGATETPTCSGTTRIRQ